MLTEFKRSFLQSWGWSEFFENQLATKKLTGDEDIGRIIGSERNWFRIQSSDELAHLASLAGKFHQREDPAEFWPAVGDWVLFKRSMGDGPAMITDLFKRKSALKRKVAGKRTTMQIIAVNFDQLFVATSLNDDLNLRRIERYLTLGWDSGAEPILLLTKSDLAEDLQRIIEELSSQFVGIRILTVSAQTKNGVDELRAFIEPHKTIAIVGSSGVGKSTLANLLMQKEVLATNSIRESDARGKHTTTSRYLLKLPNGGLLIDTPGMREIQMLDHEEGLNKQFDDIASLALRCRFSDCQHQSEPGCCVQNALVSGELSAEKWESYQKLLGEIRHYKRKTDKAFASEEKKRWKKIHRTAELIQELKGRR